MLGFDPLRLAGFRLAGDDVVPPDVAAGDHVALAAGTLEDDDVLGRLAAAEAEGFVAMVFSGSAFLPPRNWPSR